MSIHQKYNQINHAFILFIHIQSYLLFIQDSRLQKKQMLEKFYNNKYLGHFLIYAASSFCSGCVSGALGPIIPFLSDQYNIAQTQYSSLFLGRGFAFFIINLSIYKLLEIVSLHTLIIISSIFCSFFYAIFCYFQIITLQGIFIFLGSLGLAGIVIGTSISFMQTHQGVTQESWLQLKEAAFGIGSLLGPILVAYLQYQAYAFIGVFLIIVLPFYFKLPSSEIVQKQIHIENQNEGKIILLGVPVESQKYFSFLGFMIIGSQICFSGWIPSYAVLKQIDNKTQATKYTSLFWFTMTFARFLTVLIGGRIQNKVKISLIAAILTGLICCLFVQIGSPKTSLYLGSIILGALLSPNFPWMMTIAGQFNYQLTSKQLAKIFMGACLGQGILSVIFGFAMQQFSIDSFFILVTISCVLMYLAFHNIILILKKQKKRPENIELRQKLSTF